MKRFAGIILSIFPLITMILLQGCKDAAPKRYVLDGMVQGTYYHIVFYAQDTTGIKQEINHIFKRIDMSLSLWEQNSIVNKVNRNEKVELDDIFIANFNAAEEFSRLTDGCFDITVGDLVRKQGFTTSDREKLSQKQVDSLLQYVGYEKISLKSDTVKSVGNGKTKIVHRLMKKYPQTTLDFNAIAQGYTSDMVAECFKRRGIRSFIVDVGGEVVCGERKPNNQPWAVGIEQPELTEFDKKASDEITDKESYYNKGTKGDKKLTDLDNKKTNGDKKTAISDKQENNPGAKRKNSRSERQTGKIIYLENASVVTSGNYRKFYIENGVKYSHTIDPKSGKPVTHSLLSASVVAANGVSADCLATAFMVMGLEKTKRFLENHNEYAAYLIYCDEHGNLRTWQSKNFNFDK